MNLIIVILVLLTVMTGLWLYVPEDTSSLSFSLNPYLPNEIEIPLSLAILAAIIGFLALYVLVRLVVRFFRAPKDLKRRHKRKQAEKAQGDTLRGYAGLIEGNWDKAEKDLVKRLDHSPAPMLNYLGAAYAAQQRGDSNQRDQYLQQASERDPRNELAVKLTQARLQYQMGELAEARQTTEKLLQQAPRNIPGLRLLADVYRGLGDWQGVLDLTPTLRKAGALPLHDLHQLELQAHKEFTSNPALEHEDSAKILGTFKSIPRKQKKDPEILAVYARQMIQSDQMNECEKLLRKAIKANWDGELVYLYGLVDPDNRDAQFKVAKSWLKLHDDDPNLLLTMARLCARKELWDETRDYLEQAISNGAREEAYSELGALMESQGEVEKALAVYRNGFNVVSTATANAIKGPGQQLVLAGESGAIEIIAESGTNQTAKREVTDAEIGDAETATDETAGQRSAAS